MQFKILTEDMLSVHIENIASIHKSAYHNNHFTSTFSNDKLKEYYELLIKNSDLSVIATNEEGNCIGFIISGTSVSKGIQKFIKRNKLYLIETMFKNPMFLLEKLYVKAYTLLNPTTPSLAKYRLLSISINPSIQSKGIGQSMLTFFENQLKNLNISTYGLSVRNSNTRAVQFYFKNNFIKEKEYMNSTYFYKDIK